MTNEELIEATMPAISEFIYLVCPDCEFDCVINEIDYRTSIICPICAGDNGRDITLHVYDIADAPDKVEGYDDRC